MNERLESMHARLGEAHGQHGQHGAGWPSSSSSSSHAITRRPSSAHAATPDSSARGRARVPSSGVRELLRSEMRAASGGRRPSLELRPSLRQPTFQTPLPNGALARVVSIARVDRGVGVQRTLSGRANGRHEGAPAAEQWMGGSGELGKRLSS
eukprot:scaffold80182_cov60-Phaeocystis_antarctica.AAC.3